jgi:two-component system sensor histidine kinase KdpD
MADGLRCRWLAVHVEAPEAMSNSAEAQLEKNLATARELGAEVITTTDDDLVRGLLRVAREQNVTQIIVGKPGSAGWLDWFLRGDRFLRRLTRESGDIDLHVVRAEKAAGGQSSPVWRLKLKSRFQQYLFAIGAVAMTAVLNLGLMPLTGPRVPGLVFLLAVILLALRVGRGPMLVAGGLSALIWDFFFLPPRYTMRITSLEDGMLFGTYFVVALILGQLVARIRTQELAERQREARTSALYELTRDLAEAGSRDEVVWQLIAQITRVFAAPAAVCLMNGDKLAPHPDSSLVLTEKELSVADWAYRQRKAAGCFTDNLPGTEALHLPLATERKVFGVLAVGVKNKNLTTTQRDLFETFARQAALVLDRVELRNAAEQTRLLAESDRLSQTLLNSISHELRTPLAASSSAASALAQADSAPPEHRRALLEEIQEANARLNRIVGNLLDVARLESGKIEPRLDWYDARDLVQTTVRELQRELEGHPVEVSTPAEPMLVKLDVWLMQHALANLLLNAAMHTPAGTPIAVTASFSDKQLVLSVADRGPGIPPEIMPSIFEKFFRGPGAVTGGSGLGLTIAKGFVEAHGGTLVAANRPSGGAVFTLRLPQTEKPPQTEPSQ